MHSSALAPPTSGSKVTLLLKIVLWGTKRVGAGTATVIVAMPPSFGCEGGSSPPVLVKSSNSTSITAVSATGGVTVVRSGKAAKTIDTL